MINALVLTAQYCCRNNQNAGGNDIDLHFARLQDLTKSMNCRAVISKDVCATAGIPAGALEQTEVAIRGRDEPMIVCKVDDPAVLPALVDAAAQASSNKKHAAHAG